MSRPLRLEFPGAFYHITSRGNERRTVFYSRPDRERFYGYLEAAADRYGSVIHAFCLMSNHYHLLLETPNGNLSHILQYLNGSYTTYFNVKRKRSGHLFQGRFKSILIEADSYAIELSRYIHRNPVRVGMVDAPDHYEWSSYRAYIGLSAKPRWLSTDMILAQFGSQDPQGRYRVFVDAPGEDDDVSPLDTTVGGILLGTEEFISTISEEVTTERKPDRAVPAMRSLSHHPAIDEIVRVVADLGPEQAQLARKMTLYICHRYSGMSLKVIGSHFGIGDSAVHQASKRLMAEARSDEKLRQILNKVIEALALSKVEL
jgi:putative transposase